MTRRHVGLCILFSGQPLPINGVCLYPPTPATKRFMNLLQKVVVGVFNIRKRLHDREQIQNNTSSSLIFFSNKKQYQIQKLKQCQTDTRVSVVFEELDVDFFQTWEVTK